MPRNKEIIYCSLCDKEIGRANRVEFDVEPICADCYEYPAHKLDKLIEALKEVEGI